MRVFLGLAACVLMAATPATLLGQSYVIQTIAGGSPAPATAAATSTALGYPGRVAVGPNGSVYFTALNSVFQLTSGTITRIAGNGRAGYSGDSGPATAAQLNDPQGMAFDSSGNIYVADMNNNAVRMISPAGLITTVAGTGKPGMNGDYGPPLQAQLDLPTAVAIDSNGYLYICDSANNTIRRVANGVIQPYLGNYIPGFTGDTTSVISMNDPTDIFFDTSGNLWIADYGNGRIREFGTDDIVATVVGGGTTYTEGGFPLATALAGPHSVSIDPAGNIYIADADDNRVFIVSSTTNRITTLAGTGAYGFSGDGGKGNAALVNTPTSVAVDPTGNVYFVDLYNARVRVVSSGTINTVAGNGSVFYSGDGGAAENAIMSAPEAVAYSSSGLYIADTNNQRVRQIGLDGTISTVVGTGTVGFAGDGGAASNAEIAYPSALAVDASGFLYIADSGNQRVRKVVNGTINTIAGNGSTGYSGDGGSATNAALNSPSGLAVDSAGNVYISDYGNNVVRMVTPGGIISTIAGNGSPGYSGDGGMATSAQLNGPLGLAVDASGNLYIADSGNHVVRMVNSSGIISTFAGAGVIGNMGNGGLAVSAQLATPFGLAIDSNGNVYISDSGTDQIRIVNPAGVIQVIAGTGTSGYSGDNGPALQAQFNIVAGIALDPLGNLYVADEGNNVVRMLTVAAPAPSAGALTNSASNVIGPVTPGESVTIYGSNLGPSTLALAQPDQHGNIPLQVAGTVVYFNGVPAPIFYTWSKQIAVVVPWETTPGPARVTVESGNQVLLQLPVNVVPSAPGIFTNSGASAGQALAINRATGVPNTTATPVQHGGTITIYATGVGDVSPAVSDGAPDAAGYAKPLLSVTATIGGAPAEVVYAGGDTGLSPGTIRIDLAVPSSVTGNAVPVAITVGTASSQPGVTIAVN